MPVTPLLLHDDIPDDSANHLSIQQIVHTPNVGRWRTEAMRSHKTPRLIYFTRGQGRITAAGLTSGYGPNNLVFLPGGTMYGFEAGPTVHGHMVSIPLAMAGEWPEEPIHLRLRDVAAQKEVAAHFDNLEREMALAAQSGPNADDAASARHARTAHYHLGILAVVFEQLMESRTETAADARIDSLPARIVAAYTDLIERDFRGGHGVAHYARSLGITPTHLTRCCNETCGKSALKILNDRVFFEARLMLRNSKSPIKDIAENLGFTSAAYFARSFQAATGKTPSAFRKAGPEIEAP